MQTFELADGSRKSLSFFDVLSCVIVCLTSDLIGHACLKGCSPRLGCTVLLRGGSKEELKAVKKQLIELSLYTHSLALEVWMIPAEHFFTVFDTFLNH